MILEANTVRFRLIEVADAEFLFGLRSDVRYNKFLSSVTGGLEEQRSWIRSYKSAERAGEQYYFVIERSDGLPCGVVRVYGLTSDSFCWGSWILNENKTRYAALESAFLVYDFGFGFLGYSKARFDVRKENEKVVSFHRRMGACCVGEDEDNFYFEIGEAAVASARCDFLRKIE